MKSLLLFACMFIVLTACEGQYDIGFSYDGGSYDAKPYEIFDGVYNGDLVSFRYGEGQFRCGLPTNQDNLVYYYDPMSDGTYQPTYDGNNERPSCIDYNYQRLITSESTTQLVTNG